MNATSMAALAVHNPWRLLLIAAVLSSMTGCWSRQAANPPVQQSGDDQANTDGRAIKSIGARSWYDPKTQSYRAPQVKADLDHPLRRDGTQASTNSTTTTPPAGKRRRLSLPDGDVLGYIIIVGLGVALAAVATVLVIVSLRSWNPKLSQTDRFNAIEIDPSRVADLPFDAEAEMQDPLAYARLLIGRGNYDEATIFLYGYMLLALDRAGKIVLHRGKTNRMYWHELHSEPQLREFLVPAMLAFEDVFFGRHSIQPARFLKIWGQLENFHRALAPAISEATAADRAVAT